MRKILPLGGLSSLLPNLRLRRQHYVRCCCCYTATKLLLLHYVRCCCCYRTYFSASAPSLAAAELLKRKLAKKCCIYQPPVPKVVGHSACQKICSCSFNTFLSLRLPAQLIQPFLMLFHVFFHNFGC